MTPAPDCAPLPWRCLSCGGPLPPPWSPNGHAIACEGCGTTVPSQAGIPDFLGDPSDAGPGDTARVLQANITYHDAIADRYEEDAMAFQLFDANGQARLRWAMNYMATRCGADLLIDLGCGTGNVLRAAKPYVRQSVGCDISRGMLSVCANQGFSVWRGSVNSVPLADGCADIVTACAVLHHLATPADLLAEAARLLRPGGWFYSDLDPNLTSKQLQSTRLFRLARWAWYRLLAREIAAEDPELADAQHWAEYHQNVKPGLDFQMLRETLVRVGLTNVQIICHANNPRLDRPGFWHAPWYGKAEVALKCLLLGQFSYTQAAPLFSIVAQRG